MILSGPKAAAYLKKPDPTRPALLIYGADPMRVALKRQEAVLALIGPQGDEEMRLTRLPASEINKDAATLVDATRAVGFFPGDRVVLVEGANHLSADTLATALSEWRKGDANLVVTAGDLKKTSPLRKAFDSHPNAVGIALYDDPMTAAEIDAELARAGLRDIDRPARSALTDLAALLEPGDFRQTLEKITLYKLGDPTPLTPQDVAACAPLSTEAALDDILEIVATGQTHRIGPVMARLQSQGVNAITLCIGAGRHFRTLHGLSVGARVFHPRVRQMEGQARTLGTAQLEKALKMLIDTDLALRSSAKAPQMALVERTLIRLATMVEYAKARK